jgi:hypothetical protein
MLQLAIIAVLIICAGAVMMLKFLGFFPTFHVENEENPNEN